MTMKMLFACAALCAGLAVSPLPAEPLPIEARIEQAMLGEHRSEANRDRNRYRHPVGTLTFFGLADGMKVLEIWPGVGWYTEILAPVMRHNGQYVVASWDMDVEGQPEYRYRLHQALLDKLGGDTSLYDQVVVTPWSPPESSTLGEADSYDMVLTFRNAHGWIEDGIAAEVFAEFARVLKPGGVLGVVQHRAADGAEPSKTAANGYVSEDAVVALAADAGLYLEARSEVNANPADDHDHPQGVWSLPPNLAACAEITVPDAKAACEAEYRAIGESDRMTLRFRKPLE